MGKWYRPIPDAKGFRQQGLASWYGEPFHGRKTSSGERYNMYAMTGAHKTLPLGTYVRVHNLNNNRTVVIKINDRGPFVRGRIIDLSLKAAKEIDMYSAGTAPVKIVALGPAKSKGKTSKISPAFVPINYERGVFTIQVGAFTDRVNAEQFKNKLAQKYTNVHIKPYSDGNQTIYRVRVGRCYTLQKAGEYEDTMVRHGFKDAFAVAE
jgi:rare lipoprotein A